MVFLHAITNLRKLIFRVGMAKNGCVHIDCGTLNLALSEEWIDELNWFFYILTVM